MPTASAGLPSRSRSSTPYRKHGSRHCTWGRSGRRSCRRAETRRRRARRAGPGPLPVRLAATTRTAALRVKAEQAQQVCDDPYQPLHASSYCEVEGISREEVVAARGRRHRGRVRACSRWPSVAATQQPDFDFFQSPTGNIRCVYENQGGVGCETLNNGRGVVLFSYGGTRLVSGRSLRTLASSQRIPYGESWRVSSFRCASRVSGMTCSSSVTGRGFSISRDGISRF